MRNPFKRQRGLGRSRRAVRHLERVARGERPVVVGPWTSDPGFELLYWIPLLRWLREDAGLDPGRVIAVSRAGADVWYAGVAGRYVDLVDHFPVRDLAELQRSQTGTPTRRQPRDGEMLRAATPARDVDWIHPSVLHALFDAHWRHGAPTQLVSSHSVHRPLRTDLARAPRDLPERYVVLRAAFTRHFPDTPANRDFLRSLCGRLEQVAPVVLIPGSVAAAELGLTLSETVVDATAFVAARTRLSVHTAIIGRADLLVAPYSGLTYLGPYTLTPTVAFYSRAGFDLLHFDAIERAARTLAAGRGRLYRTRHVGALGDVDLRQFTSDGEAAAGRR